MLLMPYLLPVVLVLLMPLRVAQACDLVDDIMLVVLGVGVGVVAGTVGDVVVFSKTEELSILAVFRRRDENR